MYRWWKFRRAMHESFNVHTVKPFEPVQTREAILMVSSILNDTNRWEHSFKRYASAVTYWFIELIFELTH